MKLVLALNSLGIGGTESYVFTVAEQLDRLAHEVVIYSPEPGAGAALARERGLEVVGADAVPADADGALVQDAAVAYEVAELCPRARIVFVGHSESFDPQSPPQLPGTVDVLVALNDRVAERLRRFAAGHEVVRLRQPIDTERFRAGGALPEVPRRALLLSNNNVADRGAMLEAACAEAGIELLRAGGAGRQTTDPRGALAEADIVIGYGRAILEAMACGRAAFVYDWSGGEGWVDLDSYPSIEADGFAGRGETVFDADGLRAVLRRYDRSMGPVNRDLIVAHHRANVHAQELVEIFERLTPPSSRPLAPIADMARLVRLEWRARAEIHGLLVERSALHRRLEEVGDERTAAREDLRDEREARAGEGSEARELRERELAELVRGYEMTLSWRLTAPLRRLGSRRGGGGKA